MHKVIYLLEDSRAPCGKQYPLWTWQKGDHVAKNFWKQ